MQSVCISLYKQTLQQYLPYQRQVEFSKNEIDKFYLMLRKFKMYLMELSVNIVQCRSNYCVGHVQSVWQGLCFSFLFYFLIYLFFYKGCSALHRHRVKKQKKQKRKRSLSFNSGSRTSMSSEIKRHSFRVSLVGNCQIIGHNNNTF